MAAKSRSRSPDIREAMQTIIERVGRLERAFDTNTSVFSDTMKMLEVQQGAMRLVLQDLAEGSVIVVKEEGEDNLGELSFHVRAPEASFRRRVDFNAYLQKYLEGVQEAEEAGKKGGAEPSPIVDPSSEGATIFGGDGS